MLNTFLFRKHVFSDLQPYVCTFPDCPKGDELYGSQREWFDHEVQLHRREWYCDVCLESFSQKTPFQEHIQAEHSELVTEGSFEAVISRCERAIVSGIVCPLCGIDLTFQTLEKHLGLHLQEIALFALPRPVPDEGSIGSKSMNVGFSDECSSDYSSRKSSLNFNLDLDGKESVVDRPIIPQASIEGIRCICSYQHDDGFLVTCGNCKELQHGVCMGIDKSNVPEVYECSACIPGAHRLEVEKAIITQESFLNSISQKTDEHIEAPPQTQPAQNPDIIWAKTLEIVEKKLNDNNIPPLRQTNFTPESVKRNMGAVVEAVKRHVEDKGNTLLYTWRGKEVVVVEHWEKILRAVGVYSKVNTFAIHGVTPLVWTAIREIMNVRTYCVRPPKLY